MKKTLEEKETPEKKKKGKGSGEISFQKRGKKSNVHSCLYIAPRQRKEKGSR